MESVYSNQNEIIKSPDRRAVMAHPKSLQIKNQTTKSRRRSCCYGEVGNVCIPKHAILHGAPCIRTRSSNHDPGSKPYLNNGQSLPASIERKVRRTKFLKRILLQEADDPQLSPNPCDNVQCQDDDVCINSHPSCRCDDGTFGQEGFCYLLDPCVLLPPCQSDEACISPEDDVLCKCNTGGSFYDSLTAPEDDD